MTKETLLQELREETYVCLQSSPVHGIGVFAIRDIPKGCRSIFSKPTGGWIRISMEEVASLPEHSRTFIETYYLYDEENYFIPDHGCKIMDMASYLNHSNTPNLVSVEEGNYFETTREIACGEELFINYASVVEGVEDYTK
ncbi:MAG: SET domain-containing protein [Bacteroidota bacterium]|nr:SET domain-containing protein [Bacteroidota bacterium]